MKLSNQISELMDKEFDRVNENDSLASAIEILMKKGLIGLPVTSDDGKLTGVLSEKECLKLLVHQVYHEMPSGKIKDFMKTDVRTISSDMTIEELCDLYRDNPDRRYPVVDSGELVGQVTRWYLLKTLHEALFSVK